MMTNHKPFESKPLPRPKEMVKLLLEPGLADFVRTQTKDGSSAETYILLLIANDKMKSIFGR